MWDATALCVHCGKKESTSFAETLAGRGPSCCDRPMLVVSTENVETLRDFARVAREQHEAHRDEQRFRTQLQAAAAVVWDVARPRPPADSRWWASWGSFESARLLSETERVEMHALARRHAAESEWTVVAACLRCLVDVVLGREPRVAELSAMLRAQPGFVEGAFAQVERQHGWGVLSVEIVPRDALRPLDIHR